jgi:hypothetical protein
MFNGAGTESGEQSIKWTKQSTDIARLLKVWVMDSASAKKDLEIAIREVVPEFEGLDELLRQDQEASEESKLEKASSSTADPVIPDFEGIDELKDGHE